MPPSPLPVTCGFTDAETAALPRPALFTAATETVYAVPSASPVKVADLASPVTDTVEVAGLVVSRYLVMGAPPSDLGAAHDTDTCLNPATATTEPGEPGTVGACGTTAADGLLAGPVPSWFTAATVKVYDVPLVSPPTRKLVTAEVRTLLPPGDAVIR